MPVRMTIYYLIFNTCIIITSIRSLYVKIRNMTSIHREENFVNAFLH